MKQYPRESTRPQSPMGLPLEMTPAWLDASSRAYLQQRGLSQDETESYDLGYCAAGWWKDRIIIPMYGAAGALIAYQGRHIGDEEPRYRTCGPRPIFMPWNIQEIATDEPGQLVIVEGVFDLFSLIRVVPMTVATLGTELSPWQLRELITLVQHHSIRDVAIWYDNDAMGLEGAFNLQLKLQPYIVTKVIHCITYKGITYKDPGEVDPKLVKALCGETLDG